jgi:drug/metabolite transporter (DMT)-like permease
MILLLASMWGASYLFIKLAVDDIPPAAMTELRVLLAGLLLFGYLCWRMGAARAVGELRAAWKPCFVLGVINAALPMGLVAWGETHIDSSVAGIAQSTVPLFTFILASRFLPHEPVGLARIGGVALGFAGVALLAGFPSQSGWWAVAGTLAVVLSSLSYASGGVYGQLQVHDTPGPVLATGNMLAAAVVLLPLALAHRPPRRREQGRSPGWPG